MNSQLQKIASVGGLRVTGILLQSFMLMLVGRVAGPAGVGTLQLFLTWSCTLGEFAAVGLPTLAMRKMSNMSSDRSLALAFFIRSVIRVSQLWLVLMALSVALYCFDVLSSMHQLGLVGISVFCFALYRVASEGLKAFGDTDVSVFVESAFPPLIAGSVLMGLHLLGYAISQTIILISFTLGFVITAMVIVSRLVVVIRPGIGKKAQLPSIKWKEHSPYWVTALVSIGFLNFPFIALPYYCDLRDIGAFALAFKLLNICTTILLLLGSIYGPKFARLAESGDLIAAKRLLRTSQLISLVLFVPLALLLAVIYPFVHGWFGSGFESGYSLLLILAAGQLINASTGLSGQLLNMHGEGALEMRAQILGLLIAVTLTPIAGAQHGAAGIAVVYSFAVAVKSLGSLGLANRLVKPPFSGLLQN